jgi:hypothetical protein
MSFISEPEQAIGDRSGSQRCPVRGEPVGERGQDAWLESTWASTSKPVRLASTSPRPPGVAGIIPMMPATAWATRISEGRGWLPVARNAASRQR